MTRPATPVVTPPCPVCGRQPPLGFATFNGKRYCEQVSSPDSSCLGRTIKAWRCGEPLPEEKVAAQQAKSVPRQAATPRPAREGRLSRLRDTVALLDKARS